MIKNSKQNWTVGSKVNVGFMRGLLILAVVPTPGDLKPDAYVLASATKYYKFTPHFGLEEITKATVIEMTEEAKAIARAQAEAATDAAARRSSESEFQARLISESLAA